MAGAAALVLSPAAHAQAYRCDVGGRVVFQQAPCPEGRRVDGSAATAARAAASSPATSPAAAAAPKGAALCEAHARAPATFADPASVSIGSVRYQGARALRVHQELIASRVYGLRINARGPQGGYEGERLFECVLSEDESRVLGFGPAASPPAR